MVRVGVGIGMGSSIGFTLAVVREDASQLWEHRSEDRDYAKGATGKYEMYNCSETISGL